MHFPQKKCVFIHVPKTGGNFFTHCFLKYSDDAVVTSGHQDGVDRFALTGGATKTKHQSLSDYHSEIGVPFSEYRVYAFVRPPVERMISLYYSPNRWMRTQTDGSIVRETSDKPIQPDAFKSLIAAQKSISDLIDAGNISGTLAVNGTAPHTTGATVTLLDFSDLQSGVQRFGRENGFDLTDAPDGKVNSSSVNDPTGLNKSQMDALRQIVMDTHHSEDQRFFEKA